MDVTGLEPDKVISFKTGTVTKTHTFSRQGDGSVVETVHSSEIGKTSQQVYRPSTVGGKEVLVGPLGLTLDAWIKHLESLPKEQVKQEPTQEMRARAAKPREHSREKRAEKKPEKSPEKSPEKEAANRAQETVKPEAKEPAQELHREERAQMEAPQTAPPAFDSSGALGDVAAAFDREAEQTQQAIGQWQRDIEEQVGEGQMGSVAATLASTGLSVLNFSVDSAKDMVDALRLGGGLREGTLRGVGKDLLRAATLVPGVKWLGAGAKGLASGAKLGAASTTASRAIGVGSKLTAGTRNAAGRASGISKNLYGYDGRAALTSTPKTLAQAEANVRAALGPATRVEYGVGKWWAGEIQSFARWKARARGAFMDVHHLFLEHLLAHAKDLKYRPLQRYVPSIMVEGQSAAKAGKETEHVLVHAGLDNVLKKAGLYGKSLSKAQLEDAMKRIIAYYDRKGLPQMAEAVREFREVFRSL